MFKKYLIFIVILLIPFYVFSATDVFDLESEVYMSLKSLYDEGIIKLPLTKDKLTRKEIVLYIKDAVDNILSMEDMAPEMAGKIEIVFNLLKSFQTDMMEVGYKLSEIQDKMIKLKIAQERLNIRGIKETQIKLLDTIGMRINGEGYAYMTDLLLHSGKYSGNKEKRYRPITQYIDMIFSAYSGKEIKAEAVFRLENLFGGLWGSQDIYGLKKLTITGDFPISFVVGHYSTKLTPYTLWANEDEQIYEAKIYKDKRDMIKKELYLSENKWPLTGGSLSYTGVIPGNINLEIKSIIARLQEAEKSNFLISPDFATTTTTPIKYYYDQYMWAFRVSSDLSFKDILNIGANFVEIRDITDTGIDRTKLSLNNYVTSVDALINLFNYAKIKSEFAFSNYAVFNPLAPSWWQNRYIDDTAFNIGLETEQFNTKLEAQFFVNGNSFTAYSAQARIYDGSNNYLYLTQNNTWNVSLAVPYYIIAGKIYPFTRYNRVIFTNYERPGYNLMPYVLYENNAMPYGDASPNRQGIKVKIQSDYFKDLIKPCVKFLYAQEIVSYLPGSQKFIPRDFYVLETGLVSKIFNFTVTAGYKYELTDNTVNKGHVNFTSNIINAGIEYMLFDRFLLSAGIKDIIFSGIEYPYTWNGTTWGYLGKTKFDNNILSYGFGIDFEITKQANAGISWTNTSIKDNLNSLNDYSAQEIDAKIGMKF
ncbi:MAG: hypothetical protein N3E50_09305 [Candidatus Goldbacteria bacterium]|nr:hypothetical protein [Candidatus Goldiibacteriota bacterium]